MAGMEKMMPYSMTYDSIPARQIIGFMSNKISTTEDFMDGFESIYLIKNSFPLPPAAITSEPFLALRTVCNSFSFESAFH